MRPSSSTAVGALIPQRVIFVCRPWRRAQKAPDRFVEIAAQEIRNRMPGVRFVMFGAGEERVEIAALINRNARRLNSA